MGEILVRLHEEAPHGLSIAGLGSCVAVFLYETRGRAGGLAHILLPEPGNRSPLTCPGRFAPTAVAGLIDELLKLGARRADLRAKVAGGARMFSGAAPASAPLGDRNARAAIEALRVEAIRIEGSDMGGTHGRTLLADIATGAVRITTLRKVSRLI